MLSIIMIFFLLKCHDSNGKIKKNEDTRKQLNGGLNQGIPKMFDDLYRW